MGGVDLIAQKDLTLTGDSVQIDPVIVRNDDKQKQDVNKLNRDTEYANDGSINPIFDKEKEQNRLKQPQLIGEIGNQTMDIIRAEGEIAGYKAQKDPDALVAAKEQLEEKAKENNLSEEPTEAQIQQRAYDNAMAQYGTGSDVQKAAQAVTGLLQGLAGDNLAGALANASSPYLATKIKELTTDLATGEVNKASNAMAHAVLGAVVAELNNQSVVAGGLGAGGGELSAQFILNTLFEGKKVSDLSEKEKQQVSALSQLASGLAGGLTTGDMAGAVTAAQAGKNAVENNAVAFVMTPAGPVPMPIIFPGINDADANKEMALALDNALKNIGKSINDFINGEGEVNIVEVKAALSPEQQKQFDILWERNALTVNQPPVTMESLAKQAGFGQAFVLGAREAKDQNGNTVYIMDNGGAGSQIRRGDIVQFVDEFIFVYSK